MKHLTLFFCLALSPLVAAGDPAPKEAAADYRATIAATSSLSVFEGLPHQMWDRELLAQELKRPDTTKIWNYPFYTPSVVATNADALKRVLSSPDTIVVYRGPKLCGGYHPDYCVTWKVENKTYYALVCFGCHEIVFFDGKTSLIYDLNSDAYDLLEKLLSGYAKKRPHKPTD